MKTKKCHHEFDKKSLTFTKPRGHLLKIAWSQKNMPDLKHLFLRLKYFNDCDFGHFLEDEKKIWDYSRTSDYRGPWIIPTLEDIVWNGYFPWTKILFFYFLLNHFSNIKLNKWKKGIIFFQNLETPQTMSPFSSKLVRYLQSFQ